MSNLRYRPEVDGLRAVAVMGVVLFHLGLGFPGGYVGVDVFFVISGFLITTIIVKDLNRGTFSMLNFWVRRIRRILPAVCAMVIITLVLGYIFLSPSSFEGLAKSSIAQSLMAANVYFYMATDYFAGNADYKPLLHTWSLAVEEQFYVFFPILLWGLWKWKKERAICVLLIIGCISLIWNFYGVYNHPRSTFFLLPARAWEMLAGGMLAVWRPKNELAKKHCEVIGIAGLIFIVASMLMYDSTIPFPGFAATLPVLGSVLFIAANVSHMTLSGRLLAYKPVVFIGLISYSLYLWHWPLLAVARHIIIDIDLKWKVILLVASFLAALASWRFVETPFRRDKVLTTKVTAYSFASLITLLMLALGVIVWKQKGMPHRVDGDMVTLMEDVDWVGEKYELTDGIPVKIGAAGDMSGEQQVDFALWGDSHGMVIAPTLDKTAKKMGLKGIAFLSSGTPPVTGLWLSRQTAREGRETMERNERVISYLIKEKIKNVIIVCRWSAKCNGYSRVEIAGSHTHKRQTDPMVVDEMNTTASTNTSYMVLSRQLKKMALRLNRAGIRMWIVKQVPESNLAEPAREFYLFNRFSKFNTMGAFSTRQKDHAKRQALANKALDVISSNMVSLVDPAPHFYKTGDRLKVYEKRSYYRDDDHLTRYGADQFMGSIFEEILTYTKNN